MAFISELREGRLDELIERAQECVNIYTLVEEFEFPVDEEAAAAFQTLDADMNMLKTVLEEAEGKQEENISHFNKELDEGITEVAREARDLAKAAGNEMILDEQSDRATVIAYMEDLTAKVAAQEREAKRIARYQNLFGVQETEFENLKEVAEDIALKRSMWEGDREFDESVEVWSQTVFDKIDVPAMEDKVQKFSKLTVKLERGLPPNKFVPMFKDKVEDYKNLLPVILALLNQSMKTRHWDKVEELIGAPIVRDDEFTLQKILDMGAPAHGEAIGAVSTEATQEQALEELLYKVTSKWGDVSFQVVSYKESKDTFVLGGIEEIMTALEDSMVTMATIMSSRFVKGIRSEVEKVEGQLSLFSETLDEWLSVQKNWMYLESIFSAPDIQRQLPTEAKQFFAVDKQFRDIMRKTRENDNALRAGTTPGYLESFKNANDALDRIQKNLEDYLETKRMAFPRFYFLSNDELLEILAQTKNVQAVQPHMSKCFDGIKSLDFGKDPKSVDIFAMFSGEGERVGLGKNLKAAKRRAVARLRRGGDDHLAEETGQGFLRFLSQGGTHEVGPETARADRDHGEPDILVPRRDRVPRERRARVEHAPVPGEEPRRPQGHDRRRARAAQRITPQNHRRADHHRRPRARHRRGAARGRDLEHERFQVADAASVLLERRGGRVRDQADELAVRLRVRVPGGAVSPRRDPDDGPVLHDSDGRDAPEARRRPRRPRGHGQDGVNKGSRKGARGAVRGVQLRR